MKIKPLIVIILTRGIQDSSTNNSKVSRIFRLCICRRQSITTQLGNHIPNQIALRKC